MMKYRTERYQLLVAKYSTEGYWLPYYAHLLDTAGIMEKLVNHWLPICVLENMTQRNGDVEWDKLCRFVALVHDIGKATPIFQARICERCDELRERINASGKIWLLPQWDAERNDKSS